jgi:8-oxo-dGTP pyrophosphatase MutT (NUDIX family)
MNDDKSPTPTPAATLIVVRAADNHVPEVLLLKRSADARFMPNAYVFAGGAVDAHDSGDAMYRLCPDLDDARASARLGLRSDGLRFYVAAIRETFEECGLLLAYDMAGNFVEFSNWDGAQLREIRSQLGAGETTLRALCEAHAWRLAVDRLSFFSHWITPPSSPVRFDTRFFIARAPARQSASLANEELSQLAWRTAAQALKEDAQGQLLLMPPTKTVLRELARFDDINALLDFARRRVGISATTLDMPAGGR